MALQVWLPFNGNTNNQGLSDTVITNNGAILSSNGKIGNTFHFTENGYCTLSSAIIPSESTDFSCAYWVKENSNNTVSSFRGVYNCGSFLIGQYGSKFDVYNTSGGCDLVASIDSTKWSHCCVTFSRDKVVRLYINGELAKEGSATSFPSSGTVSYIGRRANSGTNQYNDMYLNDFRIYDHCLSAKEVSEIAKGLVLHYPLNNGGFGAANLVPLSNYSNYSTTANSSGVSLDNTVLWNGMPTLHMCQTGNSSNVYKGWSSNIFSSVTKGKQYTMTVYVYTKNKSLIDSGLEIRIYQQRANGLTTLWGNIGYTLIDNNWVKLQSTYIIDNDATNAIVNMQIVKNGEVWFSPVKVEEGTSSTSWVPNSADALYSAMGLNNTTEYDCSGYSNNGTRSGTLGYSSDSPRYDGCINFNGTGYIKNSNLNLKSLQETISFWVKIPESITAQHFLFGTFNSWTSNGIGYYRDTGNKYYSGILKSDAESSYVSLGTPALTSNTWYHIAIVYTGTECILYLNGAKNKSVTYGSNGAITNPVCYLGNSMYQSTPASETDESCMSDFRIYATALSADAIKQLYSSPISVDKSGNLFACEFKEV